MSVKTYCRYTYEHDGHILPLPFNPETEPEHVFISDDGLHAVLAFLVRDDSPSDPFEDDEGEFYQFESRYQHYTARPELEDFKRIVRANPGRVVTHNGTGDWHGPGTTKCYPQSVITPSMCRGQDCLAARLLDNAGGYYIAPEDVPLDHIMEYAKSALETYSAWCNGDAYGICVWDYRRDSTDDAWGEPERDECWGYYGYSGYTRETLLETFNTAKGA